MSATPDSRKKLLAILTLVLAVLIAYRIVTREKPRTAPLTYTRGAVARASVRTGPNAAADPVQLFLIKREEKYPGVIRDIFRMENPAPPRPKPAPAPVVATAPTPTIPPVPEKTPEQIAAEAARADLSKFRFLGYLTETDSSLFLSKDGETFIVRGGDTVLRNYRVKEAGRDFVVLLDTLTKVEVKVELSGGDQAPAQPGPGPGRPIGRGRYGN